MKFQMLIAYCKKLEFLYNGIGSTSSILFVIPIYQVFWTNMNNVKSMSFPKFLKFSMDTRKKRNKNGHAVSTLIWKKN